MPAISAALLLAATAHEAFAQTASGAAEPPRRAAEECRLQATTGCTLFDGVRYVQLNRTVAGDPQVVHVLTVDLTQGLRMRLTAANRSGGLEHVARTTSEFVASTGALAAINASYFLPFAGGSSAGDDYYPHAGQPASVSGAALSHGEAVSPVETDLDARVDSMVCFADGRAVIVDGQVCPEGFSDGVAAGPRLLIDGAPAPKAGALESAAKQAVAEEGAANEAAAKEGRRGDAPRSAIGVSADGTRVTFIAVDGRQPGYSLGATSQELAQLFLQLGAHDAMSLDGGGSTTLVARGTGGPVVLNRPIHTRVPGRERPVANHIGVYREGEAPAGAASGLRAMMREYQPPVVQRLKAPIDRIWLAPEARQGVAVDEKYFYAIVNSMIGKYEKESGGLVGRWIGPRGGLIRHLNSCYADAGRLYCANSNFPETPMGSSVEIFDARKLEHLESHSLGLLDEGSLTFFEPYGKGWIAGFAHYDDTGGVGFKGAAYGAIATFDQEWRRTGGWLLPDAVQKRMAPHGASGGSLGPDGLLYVFGHDLPEMYVLARPKQGPVLLHLATIDIDAAGQAFSFDRSAGRVIYAIDRSTGTVRRFNLPVISVDESVARKF